MERQVAPKAIAKAMSAAPTIPASGPTPAPTPAPALAIADTRVILAGRTGLDAALRLDQTLELVRVATLIEAVAEVAMPLPGQPEGVTVVVSDELAREAGQGRVNRLCEQLRAGPARVRILLSRTTDPTDDFKPQSWGFDDVVGPERPSADVRSMMRAMHGKPTQPRQEPQVQREPEAIREPQVTPPQVAREAVPAVAAPAPQVSVAPAIAATRAAVQPPAPLVQAFAGLGDAVLVAELLRGCDVTAVALTLLRDRLQDPSIEFISQESQAKSALAGTTPAARVGWDEATYGTLRAARTPQDQLIPAARWFAGWLRLHDQQNQLREAAFTDSLTAANNRRYFDLFATRALGAAREKRHYLTILLFDIDNFKQYNDMYGHEAGDEILIEVAKLMRAVVRPTDRVCRLGGDEFAVIFHDPQGPRQEGSQHPADVRNIAIRFQQQVSEHKFPKLADKAQGTLTISGGLATFPWDGQTPAELLAHADKLLLQSKKAGKNAITLGPGALHS